MSDVQGMVCHKRRRRRDPLYNLSYLRLVLPGDKLARLVRLEPAGPQSRESNYVRLRLRPSRQLYPVGSYPSFSGLMGRTRRHLVLSQSERLQHLQRKWSWKTEPSSCFLEQCSTHQAILTFPPSVPKVHAVVVHPSTRWWTPAPASLFLFLSLILPEIFLVHRILVPARIS